ncbi:MAG: FAD:protein FMN transferase [Candidatus Nanopelagicales bacterium]
MISSARIDTWRTHLRLLARTDHDRSAEVRDVLVAEKDRLNDAANRFTPDSELSAVNRGAGRWVDVSWYFVEVLTAAIDAAESTDGLVSPILGRQVDAAGYRSWRTGAAPVVRLHTPPDHGSVAPYRDSNPLVPGPEFGFRRAQPLIWERSEKHGWLIASPPGCPAPGTVTCSPTWAATSASSVGNRGRSR